MKCIYLRTNLINGKQYVGQTVNFDNREHTWKCNKIYSGGIIDRARKKYGIENFKTEILRECSTNDELNYWEAYYIKELNTKTPNGYNLTDGGDGLKGLKFTEEHKRKISKALKGRIVTQTTRDKISRSHKGKKLGEKRPWMSERMKGKKNPFYHKTHSKETIEKIKAANKGKKAYNKGKTYEELFGEEKAEWLRKKAVNNAYRVDQIDPITNEVVHQWKCAKDAARELGLEYTNINKCANGKYKTAFGYIWKRVD